jgi:hypothetical protein
VIHVEDALPQGGPVPGASPGHEENRIGLRGVVLFTIVLFVTVIVVESVLGLSMKGLAGLEKPVAADDPGRKPIEVDHFPAPRLQPDPNAELVEVKEAERSHVESYGWIDRKAGIAHIPVDRAMEILAKTGLPKVAAPPPAPGTPPNTSIPPGTKRDEAGPEMKQGGKP